MLKNKQKSARSVKKLDNTTPVTVRLTDEQLAIVEQIAKEMGLSGKATVLKHCLTMRAKELKIVRYPMD